MCTFIHIKKMHINFRKFALYNYYILQISYIGNPKANQHGQCQCMKCGIICYNTYTLKINMNTDNAIIFHLCHLCQTSVLSLFNIKSIKSVLGRVRSTYSSMAVR